MDRRKLDYMIKNLSIQDKKELYGKIDLYGDGDFYAQVIKFLENPETKDPFILSIIPGYQDKIFLEAFKDKYRKKFEYMNQLCTKNKTNPLFPEPADLKKSEETRKDLIKKVPEEILNKFFGVSDYYDYRPPIYEDCKSSEKTPAQPESGC